MYGLTRGTVTLVGVAVAGFLLWLATQLETDSNGEYWAFVGLIAAAGLTMAVSQLLGGWTKWGWPRLSPSVFVLGFLPALVVGGWVLLAAQSDANWFADTADNWAGDVGLGGLLEDFTGIIPAIAFGLGLLLGLTLDTTGPRVRRVDTHEREVIDERVASEPVAAERAAPEATRARDAEPEAVGAGAAGADRRVEIREGGEPLRPEPESDVRRRPPASD